MDRFEKKVKVSSIDNFELVDGPANINSIEKKIGINLKNNQNIIEFSPITTPSPIKQKGPILTLGCIFAFGEIKDEFLIITYN